jgi:2-methylcitrate dehydratase PrpD
MVEISVELARFIKNLDYDAIPEKVVELVKDQVLGIVASMYAGSSVEGCKVVRKTAVDDLSQKGGMQPATVIPSGEKLPLENALMVNQANAVALDYDDYLFFAHTGITTVPLALALAELFPMTGKDLIACIVAGNEVTGRVGASIVLGPQNGQLWSYVHLAGACAMASRALKLDEEKIANALGIAMYISTVAMYRGFMGPQSKLLTGSVPTRLGLEAAYLAKNGLTGALDIFESPLGWCSFTADVPIPSFITSSLGTAWVTETIAFKMVPGCAYVSPVADCLKQILEKDPGLDHTKIEEIVIQASVLMSTMDDLSRPFTGIPELTRAKSHVALNFYIPYNVAVMLIDKKLTPEQLTLKRICDPEIHELAKKVRTVSDLGSTSETLGLTSSINIGASHGRILASFKDAKVGGLDMSFGAKVTIKMKGGIIHTAEVKSPPGSPKNRTSIEPKFKQEARAIGIPDEKIDAIIDKVRNLDKIADIGKELVPFLCHKGESRAR